MHCVVQRAVDFETKHIGCEPMTRTIGLSSCLSRFTRVKEWLLALAWAGAGCTAGAGGYGRTAGEGGGWAALQQVARRVPSHKCLCSRRLCHRVDGAGARRARGIAGGDMEGQFSIMHGVK